MERRTRTAHAFVCVTATLVGDISVVLRDCCVYSVATIVFMCSDREHHSIISLSIVISLLTPQVSDPMQKTSNASASLHDLTMTA